MLNGIDPVIIFEFYKAVPTAVQEASKIPLVSQYINKISFPPIPIYLSETITGIYIDNEDKMVNIATETDTLTSGENPDVNQKGVGNVVAINLVAIKNSIGISLLSALVDQVFEKASSKEYSITYMHGAITIFRGLLSDFQVNQNANNNLLSIKIELTKGESKPTAKAPLGSVPKTVGTAPL